MDNDHRSHYDLLLLICTEYLEIPRLHLTRAQVERLWGVDTDTADLLLRTLVDVRFLSKNGSDGYVRASAAEAERQAAAPLRRQADDSEGGEFIGLCNVASMLLAVLLRSAHAI